LPAEEFAAGRSGSGGLLIITVSRLRRGDRMTSARTQVILSPGSPAETTVTAHYLLRMLSRSSLLQTSRKTGNRQIGGDEAIK